MTVSFWQDRSWSEEHHSDILVLGAGLAGASCAYWLASEGLSVTVVDARTPGAGASGRNAGMVLAGTADPYSRAVDLMGREKARRIWEFTVQNRDLLLEHILVDREAQVSLQRTGSVHAALSEHELSELTRSADLLNEDGFAVTLLDARTVAESLGTEAFLGGLYDDKALALQPVHLNELVLERALEQGARFMPHHEVFSVTSDEESVSVRSHRATFKAEMAICCTNAYSPLIAAHFNDKVYPTRGQMLVTEPLDEVFVPWPVYADFGYEYFRQLPTGELVAGGWRQHHETAEKGYSDETTEAVQEGLWSFLVATFPQLDGVRVTHRWGGVMGFSADGLPLIGELPGQSRIKYLVGFTGHGFGFAFHAARVLAELVVNGTSPGWLAASRLRQQG